MTTVTIQDLENAALDVSTIEKVAMVGTNADTVQNREGATLDTLQGRLKKIGYEPPIAYTVGITFTDGQDSAKTVDRNGVIYASLATARPFTTVDWATDAAKFFVVQDPQNSGGNVRTDNSNTYDNGTTQTFDSVVASDISLNGADVETLITANSDDVAVLGASVSANSSDIDSLEALSGVASGSTDLGTFTGTIIPDNSDNKQALQSLETAVDAATGIDYISARGSGYREWNGGTVECWGTGATSNIGVVVTLPRTMPSTNYVVQCTYSDGGTADRAPIIVGARSTTQFTISFAQNVGTFSWYAISV